LTEIEVMPQYGNSKYENHSSVLFASSNQKSDELLFYEVSIASKASSFKQILNYKSKASVRSFQWFDVE
jgi:hypothetical protein